MVCNNTSKKGQASEGVSWKRRRVEQVHKQQAPSRHRKKGRRRGSHALQARTKPSRPPRVAMATRHRGRPGLAGPSARGACWESTSSSQLGRFELGGPDACCGAVECCFFPSWHPVLRGLQFRVSALRGLLLRPHDRSQGAEAGGGGDVYLFVAAASELQQFHHVTVVSPRPPELLV
ncbi:Hypothetical predicted protein [Marmota monax]|uniref:Uncharacterized protein n=1 Tax=Marmota monax TaxID=9995 RepID=A0A5E4BQW9_MARMO|nr:Hypothetical predicted protein [Marmota monax]